MTKATRDQFEFRSDILVVHRPTGATFSTYRYENPEEGTYPVHATIGRAGEILESGEEYSEYEVRTMAAELLRERALLSKRG